MSMRFFLWSYGNRANFEISRSKNILGFPEGADNSWRKAILLNPGDIVLIRDSNARDHLKFYGHCVVTEEPYKSEELTWPDEIQLNRAIYLHRVAVDFTSSIISNLDNIDWDDLLNLQWHNKKGILLNKKGLSVLFSKGNFIEGVEAEKLAALLFVQQPIKLIEACDINQPSEPSRVLSQEYRILRDTQLTRKVKQLHDFKCQICGVVLEFPNGSKYAEAHHIKPLGSPHNGPDTMENIVCVCPNHHALLDYGAIKLEVGLILEHDKHKINEAYIGYHNLKIYQVN